MAFYKEMQQMTRDLLKPDTEGGLGQGEIVLKRVTPGTPNPDTPWVPVEPTVQAEKLKGAARGVSGDLIGTEVNGTILVSTDLTVICEVPKTLQYTAGDVLTIDGQAVTVLSYSNIPAAGIAAAVRFIVRG